MISPEEILNFRSRKLSSVLRKIKKLHPETKSSSHGIFAPEEVSVAAQATGVSVQKQISTDKPGSVSSAWVPADETVTIAGRKIGGMIYVGAAPEINVYGEKCRAYIDPSLPVGEEGGDFEGDGMSYWPGYDEIMSISRATYLDWLASGRSDPRYNVGYMFMYFYGLERRIFQDHPPPSEREAIIAEVKRLRGLYQNNYSAGKYLSRFIDVTTLQSMNVAEIAPVYENYEYDLPMTVRFAIGAKITRGERVDADWMLSWLMCHPERRLRTPSTRCQDEFRMLFKLKFEVAYPGGLPVEASQRMLKETYCAASGEFESKLRLMVDEKPVTDISYLREPVTLAQNIANDAMDALDKYSRYLGRNPEGRGSVEAHALLPIELWPHFPSDKIDALRRWSNKIILKGGFTPTGKLIKRLEGQRPDRIGKQHLISAADALARLGFGLAPDPRFAERKPDRNEPVILFRLREPVSKLEEVSGVYQKVLTELVFATFVAWADNEIVPAEREAMQRIIEDARAELKDDELDRLSANLRWLLKVRPNFKVLRRHVKKRDVKTQEKLKRIVLLMANADSIIQPEEIRNIEKVYAALGLETGDLYSKLHAASISREQVLVSLAQDSRQGKSMLKESKSDGSVSLQLNTELIRTRREETVRAAKLLQSILSDDELESDNEQISQDLEEDPLAGLSKKHQGFLRVLLERKCWSEKDYEELASRHELMPGGVLEAINEWAAKTFEDELIDAYGDYEMSPDVVEQIKVKMNEGAGFTV